MQSIDDKYKYQDMLLYANYSAYIKMKIIDYYRHTSIDKELRNIIKESTYSFNELKEIQKNKLIRLLMYVKSNHNYYKNMLKNISENDIMSNPYDVLSSMPYLTKNIIKDNYCYDSITNSSKMIISYTGGSSGDCKIICVNED